MQSKEPLTGGALSSLPLVELWSDLTEDALYGLRKLTVTCEVVSVANEQGAEILRIPVAEIKSARHEPRISKTL